MAGWSGNAPDLPDESTCFRRIHAGRLHLCMGLFWRFCERAPSKRIFPNVTRGHAGKGTVRYAWQRVRDLNGQPAYEYSQGAELHYTAISITYELVTSPMESALYLLLTQSGYLHSSHRLL
jgi:hypothetical protein